MLAPDIVLARLTALHPKSIDLTLGRIARLLERLGRPQDALPPVIHVAGTNGKGSTIATMRAILEAMENRVHVYTSPHLVRFNERIRLGAPGGGILVDDAVLIDALLECEEVNGGEPITFFEITTAAAFLLFSRNPADVLLLETGLGGRLDATNLVERPIATLLTPIAHDHMGFLGNTLPQIAREKAGILKSGVCTVIAAQKSTALEVIVERCEELACPLYIGGQEWTSYEENGRLIYQDTSRLIDLPLPSLAGRFQVDNAGLAIAALRFAPGISVSDQAIETGIGRVTWPARLMRLKGKITALVPENAELWLDGSHNPHAARAIAASLADMDERASRPVYLIAAMLSNKDAKGYFEAFKGLVRQVITVPMREQESAVKAEDLAAIVNDIGMDGKPAPDLAAALDMISNIHQQGTEGAPPRILICGSLYFAGEVLTQYAV